jgi:hypothetical protein
LEANIADLINPLSQWPITIDQASLLTTRKMPSWRGGRRSLLPIPKPRISDDSKSLLWVSEPNPNFCHARAKPVYFGHCAHPLLSTEKGVFGIPLSDSIKYSYSTISYMDDETNEQCYGVIPTIIAKCGSFLKEEGTAQPQLPFPPYYREQKNTNTLIVSSSP